MRHSNKFKDKAGEAFKGRPPFTSCVRMLTGSTGTQPMTVPGKVSFLFRSPKQDSERSLKTFQLSLVN